MREDILDQEASLQRARLEASLADGISWGMEEDAIEEAEVWDLMITSFLNYVLNRDLPKLHYISFYFLQV